MTLVALSDLVALTTIEGEAAVQANGEIPLGGSATSSPASSRLSAAAGRVPPGGRKAAASATTRNFARRGFEPAKSRPKPPPTTRPDNERRRPECTHGATRRDPANRRLALRSESA